VKTTGISAMFSANIMELTIFGGLGFEFERTHGLANIGIEEGRGV
jgi:hypothetical protein